MDLKLDFIKKNLKELKVRIIKSTLFFFILFIIFFFNSNKILNFLSSSLLDQLKSQEFELVFSGLISPFSLKIDLAIILAFYFSIPFFIFQLYSFIAPGLYKKERKIIFPYLFFSPILFSLAIIFVFFLILPNAQSFFLNLSNGINLNGQIKLMININEYLSMCFRMFFLFGLCFQFPLILKILLDFEILSIESLKKSRKFFIVFIFIIAAILTPPDILSQIFLAIPLIFLFEIVILLQKIKIKKLNQL